MNFIAGTAMLFLGAEDTFWFLVAITEKYFHQSYFDQSLTGAQADQVIGLFFYFRTFYHLTF